MQVKGLSTQRRGFGSGFNTHHLEAEIVAIGLHNVTFLRPAIAINEIAVLTVAAIGVAYVCARGLPPLLLFSPPALHALVNLPGCPRRQIPEPGN